jgi:hypothetical protein
MFAPIRSDDSASRRSSRSIDRALVVLIVVIPFVVYGRALLPGRVLAPVDLVMTAYPWRSLAPTVVPANGLLTDVTYLVHPLLLWGGREIAEGRLPLWNPHIFAGAPYLANPHTAMFFPLTWLVWLLPAAPALTLHAVGKIVLIGLATYWCGRVLALSRGAAFFGAVAFMLSGPVIVWLHWPYATTMAFLPLLVGVVERMRERGDARSMALLAITVALDLFAGYPQGSVWTIVVAGVWALARARGAVGGGRRFAGRVVAGIGLGGLAASVQILPFLEYARESAVVAYREQWMPYLWLPGRAAVTWLVPFFFGDVRHFQGDWNFNVVTLTVGVVPWVVLPAAFAVAFHRTATLVLTAILLVGAAVVYGVPWVGPSIAALPVLGWGQSLRVAPVLSFALAMLGAIGVDAITALGPERRRRVGFAVAGTVAALVGLVFVAVVGHPEMLASPSTRWRVAQHVLAFLAAVTATALVTLRCLRRPEPRWRWTVALVAIELATLAPVAVTVNAAGDARWLYPEPPVMRALHAATSHDHARILLGRHNLAMLYGLFDPTGHDGMTPADLESIAGPLGTGRTVGTIGSEPLGAGAVISSPVVDTLGIRWFVVPPQAGPPRPDATLRYDAPDARVYENPRAMSRVFLVPAGRCVTGAESRALVRGGISSARELLLTGNCAGAPTGTPENAVGSAVIRQYGSDRVVVDVAGVTPAYLVLTDTWFPGWRATIDGAPTAVFRAHHAFRAVWVPPGQHAVAFEYRPASVISGALVSGLALGGIALLAFGRSWRIIPAAAAIAVMTLGAPEAAALPSMPLDVTLPGHANHLDTVRVTIVPRARPTTSAPPVDLYLVWAWRPDARFIAPDGSWTSNPVPVRRAARLAELAPLTVEWRADPVGRISIALIAVEAGAHPIDRTRWVWSPELSWVTVHAPSPLDASARRWLTGLGVAALGAVAIVFAYATRTVTPPRRQ